MASLAQSLKSEITRLSRRELKSQVEPLRKQSAIHRRHIAALKRQVVALEKLVGQLKRGSTRAQKAAPTDSGDDAKNTRFSAKGFRTLRSKLGFSAAQMGTLLGVSGQSVYNWEAQKAVPRKAQLASLAQLRGVGKREALARLEAVAVPKKKKKR